MTPNVISPAIEVRSELQVFANDAMTVIGDETMSRGVATPVGVPARRVASEPLSDSRYRFTYYPRSWYRVAHSSDVPRGGLLSVHYFGRDLVVFRGDDGVAHVLDAYCPHLGAHLGVGGVVKGSAVVCPFHGWTFDGDGACIEIPYCDKIPTRAKMDSWLVSEVNGMIFVWFDQAGGEPSFEIPAQGDKERSHWRYSTTLSWRFRSHVQEVVENGVDFAHFNRLHKFLDVPAPSELHFDGEYFRVQFDTRRRLMGVETLSHMQAEFHGMGYYVTPVTAGKVQINTFMSATPVDEDLVEVKLDVMFPAAFSWWRKPLSPLVKRVVIKGIKDEFERDIRVWERKVYRETPGLCQDDGPIMKVRKWCEQFYPAAAIGVRTTVG